MTSKEYKDVYGLVLSGGKSTRMGSDKSLLNYHGKPQREHLYELLKSFLPKVYISHRADQKDADDFNRIEDQHNFESPINGILSAFDHNPKVAWLVVACDMPFITEKEVDLLLKCRNQKKVATCFNGTDNKPHPLFTIYEPHSYYLLQNHIKESVSPRAFLMKNQVHVIKGASHHFLENANSPEDFHRLKDMI